MLVVIGIVSAASSSASHAVFGPASTDRHQGGSPARNESIENNNATPASMIRTIQMSPNRVPESTSPIAESDVALPPADHAWSQSKARLASTTSTAAPSADIRTSAAEAAS